jgi:hypothetical protein
MRVFNPLTILAISAMSAFSAMQVITFSPDQIAVGNTGQPTLFIGSNSVLSGLPSGGACEEWGRTYFYIELNDDRAKHFEALALSAQATGKRLLVYYSDSFPQIVMQWIGQTGCKMENVRIEG